MKMKNIVPFLMILSSMLVSCSKTDEAKNFYSNDYRTGLWVNSMHDDTLQFVDASHMIRKGKYYVSEQNAYKINNNQLIIGSANFSNTSQHSIIKAEGNCVVLGDMYITIDVDIPGTFYKVDAK